MEYSITLKELIERPIIRNDFYEEWRNKMTNDELIQFDKESYDICISNGIPNRYPEINSACLSKHIDRDIAYNILKKTY